MLNLFVDTCTVINTCTCINICNLYINHLYFNFFFPYSDPPQRPSPILLPSRDVSGSGQSSSDMRQSDGPHSSREEEKEEDDGWAGHQEDIDYSKEVVFEDSSDEDEIKRNESPPSNQSRTFSNEPHPLYHHDDSNWVSEAPGRNFRSPNLVRKETTPPRHTPSPSTSKRYSDEAPPSPDFDSAHPRIPKKILMRDLGEEDRNKQTMPTNNCGNSNEGNSRPKTAWALPPPPLPSSNDNKPIMGVTHMSGISPIMGVASLEQEEAVPEELRFTRTPSLEESESIVYDIKDRGPIASDKTLYEPEGKTSQEKFRKYHRMSSGDSTGHKAVGGAKLADKGGAKTTDNKGPNNATKPVLTSRQVISPTDDSVFLPPGEPHPPQDRLPRNKKDRPRERSLSPKGRGRGQNEVKSQKQSNERWRETSDYNYHNNRSPHHSMSRRGGRGRGGAYSRSSYREEYWDEWEEFDTQGAGPVGRNNKPKRSDDKRSELRQGEKKGQDYAKDYQDESRESRNESRGFRNEYQEYRNPKQKGEGDRYDRRNDRSLKRDEWDQRKSQTEFKSQPASDLESSKQGNVKSAREQRSIQKSSNELANQHLKSEPQKNHENQQSKNKHSSSKTRDSTSQDTTKPVNKPQDTTKPVSKPQDSYKQIGKPVDKPQETTKAVSKPQDTTKPVNKPHDTEKKLPNPTSKHETTDRIQDTTPHVSKPQDTTPQVSKPQDTTQDTHSKPHPPSRSRYYDNSDEEGEDYRPYHRRGSGRGNRGRGSRDRRPYYDDYYEPRSYKERSRPQDDSFPSRTFNRGYHSNTKRGRGRGRGESVPYRGGGRGNQTTSLYNDLDDIDSPSDWEEDDELTKYEQKRKEKTGAPLQKNQNNQDSNNRLNPQVTSVPVSPTRKTPSTSTSSNTEPMISQGTSSNNTSTSTNVLRPLSGGGKDKRKSDGLLPTPTTTTIFGHHLTTTISPPNNATISNSSSSLSGRRGQSGKVELVDVGGSNVGGGGDNEGFITVKREKAKDRDKKRKQEGGGVEKTSDHTHKSTTTNRDNSRHYENEYRSKGGGEKGGASSGSNKKNEQGWNQMTTPKEVWSTAETTTTTTRQEPSSTNSNWGGGRYGAIGDRPTRGNMSEKSSTSVSKDNVSDNNYRLFDDSKSSGTTPPFPIKTKGELQVLSEAIEDTLTTPTFKTSSKVRSLIRII